MRTFRRWVVLIAGICLGLAGLSMLIGGLAAHAASSPENESATGFVVALVGAALFAFGWLLGMLSFAAFTAIAGLAMAFWLVMGGIASALFAAVIARTD